MRRLIVLSDSHGKAKAFENVCLLHPEAERIVFLGDGEGDFEYIQSRHPEWSMTGVCGNCDRFSKLPEIEELTLGEWKLLLVHGHKFAIKTTYKYVIEEAEKRNCNAVLYGHTHSAYVDKIDGIWVLNPGAVMDYRGPRYAVLDLDDDGKFIVNLAEYNNGVL